MQQYPWDLADPRKRPKRLAKKLAKRWNWRRFPPRNFRMVTPPKNTIEVFELEEMRPYLPTRKGVRRGHMLEMGMAMNTGLQSCRRTMVGEIQVSTTFLFIDHGFDLSGLSRCPVLWETMLFSGRKTCDEALFRSMGFGEVDAEYLGYEQWRYKSRQEAIEHHEKLVGMLRSGLN